MKMVGHKIQAIYSRYAIADEGMLKGRPIKLEQLHVFERETGEKDRQSSGKVSG